MKCFIYIFLLLSIVTAPSVADNSDSLKKVWKNPAISDTTRVQSFYKLIFKNYLFKKPDSAFVLAQEMYEFSKSRNNQKGMANSLNLQGLSFYVKWEMEKAIEFMEKSLEINKKLDDKKGIAQILNNLGIVHKKMGLYDNAISFYSQGIKIGKLCKDYKSVVASMINIGLTYHIKGEYAMALENFSRGYAIATKLNYKREIATALNAIGIIHKDQGNYIAAIENYNKSIEIFNETKDSSRLGTTYLNIGNIYQIQEELPIAKDYYTKSLNIATSHNNKSSMALCLNNLGNLYRKTGEYFKAMEYHSKSYHIRKSLGDKNGMAASLINMGNVSKTEGYIEEALDNLYQGLELAEEIGDKKEQCVALQNIGGINHDIGNYAKAISYTKKSLKIAEEMGTVIFIMQNCEALYKTYKELENYDQALLRLEQMTTMKDSIMYDKKSKLLLQNEFTHKYEKKQALEDAKLAKELAIAEEREKHQKVISYSAGFGLILLLVFFSIIVNRVRFTKRQKNIIEEQKEQVEFQKKTVEEKNKDITDSLMYAKKIQHSMLPSDEDFSIFPESFVFFQPKDIVSGDFYWMQQHNDNVYLAGCDCTGHGVPGAFMSMIGSSLLNEAVLEKGISQPNEIFDSIRNGFIHALKQTGESGGHKDGMDATLIKWDKKNTIQIAAAFNSAIVISKGKIKEIKGDRQPVGLFTGDQLPFTNQSIKIDKGDTLYIYSDGYPDQFGGPKEKKFKLSNFKKLLLSIQAKNMEEQKRILDSQMTAWKGQTEQIDDILVIGIRF